MIKTQTRNKRKRRKNNGTSYRPTYPVLH